MGEKSHKGERSCVHIKERVEESCSGVDQAVQRGGGSYGFKAPQGHRACFSTIDGLRCVCAS